MGKTLKMRNYLNITNGDCAVELMKKAGVPGDFLPWRDVLHDGPVPECRSLEELSAIRSKFIVDRGWGTFENITGLFRERDAVLKSSGQYEKVILWFEHDLYDQLQLLQILDWYHQNRPRESALSIICTDRYLGTLSSQEMTDLLRYEEPVTEKHFNLSSKAWSAFRAATPEKWCTLLTTDTTALPFLNAAVRRLLEEYPSCNNGLSRTVHQALTIIAQGETRPGKIFKRYQESEESRFLGDSSFWVILNELLNSSPPLLTLSEGKNLSLPSKPNQELTITPTARAVLAGEKNWLETARIDRWLGGVHLTPDNIWCWHAESNSCRRPY